MPGVDDYITAQLTDLLDATTADDVIEILSWQRHPLAATGHADGHFAGHGGMATVWDALRKADWHTAWSGGEHHYVMRAPDGTTITYQDGHIYRGDRRPTEET